MRSTGRPPSSPCPLLCSRHLSASSLPGKRGLAGRQRCGNPLLPGRCAAMGRALFCSSHEDASLCSWERGSSLPRLSCPPWEATAVVTVTLGLLKPFALVRAQPGLPSDMTLRMLLKWAGAGAEFKILGMREHGGGGGAGGWLETARRRHWTCPPAIQAAPAPPCALELVSVSATAAQSGALSHLPRPRPRYPPHLSPAQSLNCHQTEKNMRSTQWLLKMKFFHMP